VLALFCLCATLYLLCANGHPWIEADGQVRRAAEWWQHGVLGSAAPFLEIDMRGPDGLYYDVHGLLNIVLHVPFVACASLLTAFAGARVTELVSFVASFSGVVINSATVSVFYVLLRRLPISRMPSLLASTALAFGTMIFPFAGGNYEGNADILCLLTATSIFFAFSRDTSERRARRMLWCGLACGAALLGREHNVLLIGLIGLCLLWHARRAGPAPLMWFLAGILPLALAFAWYNAVRTGTPFQTPIALRIQQGAYPFFKARSPFGVMSLLISPGGSLFVFSPIAALALAGVPEYWRRYRRELLFAAAFCSLTLVAAGLTDRWFGLVTWGPRYANPTLPFLLVPLAVWLERHERSPAAWARALRIFWTTMVVSVAMQLAGTLLDWHSRLGYLWSGALAQDETRHWNRLYYSIRYSEWWNGITALAGNVRYILTGTHPAAGDPALSAGTQYVGRTIDTWWNRLLFEGVSPLWIVAYVGVSAAIIALCVRALAQPRPARPVGHN
jgi:hypothetical protein